MKSHIKFCPYNIILDKSHCRTLYKRKLMAQQSLSTIQNKSYFQFDKLQNKYTGKSREKKVFTQQTPFSNLASLFYLEVKPILLHSLHKQCNHVDGLFTLKTTGNFTSQLLPCYKQVQLPVHRAQNRIHGCPHRPHQKNRSNCVGQTYLYLGIL